ncbi:MAG: DUF1223 domain-containing protein [Asticcacaulis sp.]|nr:DUF1223 domain-containing protein [Asticcacaulis sp.]
MRFFLPLAAFAAMITACHARTAAGPAVVELFQSQGCSSCPPANAVLNSVADRGDLVTLSFSVTYWDYLGWKDSFARPEYTQRQRDYATGLHRANVATPQMVINGRGAVTGTTKAQLDAALKQFARSGPEPEIRLDDQAVTVAAQPGGHATVWLARYQPGELDVPVSAGENTGRTLPHRHIVKQLVALGDWRGSGGRYALPAPPEAGLKTAILLQDGAGGPIVAARVF